MFSFFESRELDNSFERDFDYVDDDFDENLICAICQEPFYIPISVKCGHTFCKVAIFLKTPFS